MSDLSHIYAKLHENRYEHVIRARRERDLETRVYELERLLRDAYECAVSAGDDELASRIWFTIDAALNGQSDTRSAHKKKPPPPAGADSGE